MKKHMKYTFCILIVLLISVSVLPFQAYANGPVPMPMLCFHLEDLPSGTAYVDLAVCAPDSKITQLAQQPPEGLSKDCPLVCGEYGEYVSYSFRVKGAQSTIVPDADGCVYFSHEGEIPQWGKVRLVMADSSGNILKISKPFEILPKGMFETSMNWFQYNALADQLQIETHVYATSWLFYIIISIAGVILTCGAEWVVGKLFDLTALAGKLILTTNVFSQILMRLLFVILYGILHRYVLVMVILEVLVYAGEFIVYRLKADYLSVKKLALYVVVANTTSLVLGLLLNLYLH